MCTHCSLPHPHIQESHICRRKSDALTAQLYHWAGQQAGSPQSTPPHQAEYLRSRARGCNAFPSDSPTYWKEARENNLTYTRNHHTVSRRTVWGLLIPVGCSGVRCHTLGRIGRPLGRG